MATQPRFNEAHEKLSAAASKLAAVADSGIRLSVLRKKLIRRALPDHSQQIRRSFQLAFLLLNLWLGASFYFWVRHFETGSHERSMARPAGVEGWLPIAGLMNTEVLACDWPIPVSPSRSAFLIHYFPGNRIFVSQGILQLVVPGGYAVGILVARWPRDLSAKLSFTTLD